jgi:capsular polysaccharide transport system permease protein
LTALALKQSRDSTLRIQARVISALILRDVKTGSEAVGELHHRDRLAAVPHCYHHGDLHLPGTTCAVGDSAPLYFATGILPFIVFNYPSRLMMQAISTNAPLLAFPVVTALDLILARAISEIITSFAVVIVFAAILYGFDVQIWPREPTTAVAALCAVVFLAITMGIVNSVIQTFFKFWFVAYILLLICLYMVSGILFMTETVPEEIRWWLVWNPLLHGIDWFRSAYYEGYSNLTLDRGYLLIFGLFALAIGLVAERFTRRHASY